MSRAQSPFPKLLKVSRHSCRRLFIDISFKNAINPSFSPAALWLEVNMKLVKLKWPFELTNTVKAQKLPKKKNLRH